MGSFEGSGLYSKEDLVGVCIGPYNQVPGFFRQVVFGT